MASMVYKSINRMSYIYSSNAYWTMSPSYFPITTTSLRLFTINPGFVNEYMSSESNVGIRLVINLSKDVEITGGIGTSSDPFVIHINK